MAVERRYTLNHKSMNEGTVEAARLSVSELLIAFLGLSLERPESGIL